MRRLARSKKPLILILLTPTLALILLIAAGQHLRLFERAWFNVNTLFKPINEQAIALDQYQVTVEAQVIEGLNDDVSALTFDPVRKSLFTGYQPEFRADRAVTRWQDPAAHCPDRLWRSGGGGIHQRRHLRHHRRAPAAADQDSPGRRHPIPRRAAEAEQMTLGVHMSGNKGFGVGLAYDSVGKRLFVAKERDPMLICEVHGLFHHNPEKSHAVHVINNPKRDAGLFVRDLSSLQYDERSGHLLALSEESRLIIELDIDGQPLSTLSLSKGRQGLQNRAPGRRPRHGRRWQPVSGERAESVLRVQEVTTLIHLPRTTTKLHAGASLPAIAVYQP